MSFLHLVLIHVFFEILRKLGNDKRSIPSGGLAMPSGIQHMHLKILRKFVDLPFKVGAILPVSMQQDRGNPSPFTTLCSFMLTSS